MTNNLARKADIQADKRKQPQSVDPARRCPHCGQLIPHSVITVSAPAYDDDDLEPPITSIIYDEW